VKPTYLIKNWDRDFENHESRKIRKTRWVSVPNKHDGKTYKRIARHPRANDLFCAWSLIVQVASKMPVRGVLADDDGPLDADDLADQTSFEVEIFELAFEVLVQPRFGWLDVMTNGMSVVPAATSEPGDLGPLPGEEPLPAGNEAPAPGDYGGQRPLLGAESPGATKSTYDLPFNGEEFRREWSDYEKHRAQMKKKLTPIARHRLFKQFEGWGEVRTVAALRYSMADGRTWQGVFEPRIPGAAPQRVEMRAAMESETEKTLRTNCRRCNGTNTELVPGKGARPCDHKPKEETEY